MAVLLLKLFSSNKYLYLQNFEAAVHDNVLVNGQTWEEAPDVEGDSLCRSIKLVLGA